MPLEYNFASTYNITDETELYKNLFNYKKGNFEGLWEYFKEIH